MSPIDILKRYCLLGEELTNETYLTNLAYRFYDDEKFSYIRDVGQMMKIYWYEILARAHWVAISSVLRNTCWLKAILYNYEQNNFLAFAGALRSYIESCGDSMTSMKDIPHSFARDYKQITMCVKGNSKKMIISKEIEDRLIHFTYARKVSNEEKQNKLVPESHIAKFTTHYLNVLDNNIKDGPVMQLYSELCQISHPAAQSLLHFMNQTSQGNYEIIRFNLQHNRESISNLIDNHQEAIIQVSQYGYNNSLVLLKLLNKFNLKELITPQLNNYPLQDIKAWNNIKQIISEK